MPPVGSTSPLRAPAALALAVFALVLVDAPFLHHDAACLQKSSTHCAACVWAHSPSPVAEGASQHFGDLTCVAAAARVQPTFHGALLAPAIGGRAPPA
jgi:hypothetical protein